MDFYVTLLCALPRSEYGICSTCGIFYIPASASATFWKYITASWIDVTKYGWYMLIFLVHLPFKEYIDGKNW